MKDDIINVEVTEDGMVKLTTDKISMPNHALSENLVRTIARLAGGTVTRKGKRHSHGHHGTHTHEGERHSH